MGSHPVIAVVDDDQSVRAALGSLLRSVGFAVLPFSSAEEFLRGQHLSRIDCLILDWRMPGIDGMQLQCELAASGSRIPIIFLTAHCTEEGRAQAVRKGAIAFLNKPVDAEVLLDAVRSGVRQSEA